MHQYARNRRYLAILVAGFVVTLGIGAVVLRTDIYLWHVLRPHFERLPNNAQGMREFLHLATGEVFVYIPGGSFLMGITEAEAEELQAALQKQAISDMQPGLFLPETPQHEVTVSHFLIAKFEVSQRSWKKVMGQLPFRDDVHDDDRPVFLYSYDRALEYCARVGLVLPSEAQWEYACRAGHSDRADLEKLKAYARRLPRQRGTEAPNA